VLTHFDRAVVAVRDLEQETHRYTRLFGRLPSWRGRSSLVATEISVFRLANCSLHLVSARVDGPLGPAIEARLEKRGEGLCMLAFATDDADVCAGWLRSRGLLARDPIDEEGVPAETDSRQRSGRSVLLVPSATREVLISANEYVEPECPPAQASPNVDEQVAISALDHVVVGSTDPEASRSLYGDGLGLRLALDRRVEERGIRMLFFRIGGVTVEVVGPLETPKPPGSGDSLRGLAWQVADVPGARERLLAEGFDVSEHRVGNKPGTRVCTVRSDTAGVPTLLIGPDR